MNPEKLPRKAVWLDCDPGVDDMIAIMLAAHNPSLNLLGISTISGNSLIENVNKNALDILNISGFQEIPVFQGSDEPICRKSFVSQIHGDKGLGFDYAFPEHELKLKEENLFSYLSNLILSSQVKITLIATGPLTNYALLLKTYPQIKKNIDSIVFMGGSVEFGNITPAAEFNISWDPDAAKIVFNSGLKLVMIPLGVTLRTQIGENVINYLKDFHSNFGRYLSSLFEHQNAINQKYYKINSPLHDPCAVAYVIDQKIFQIEEMNVEIETKSEFCDGRTVCDVFNKLKKKKNAIVGIDIDLEKFWCLLFEAWKVCNKNSLLNV